MRLILHAFSFSVITLISTTDLLAQLSNTFPKTGPVGVGTLQPRGALEVKGTSFLEQLVIGNSPKSTNALLELTTPEYYNDSTVFLISSNNRRLFQVGSNGIVRAREIIVDDANNWPDYVFKDDYYLLPMDELRAYITANRHLPNIPSSREIDENGVRLAEMNRLLLEKIEELTLYMLQQEVRIRQLEKMQQK